MLHRQWNMKNEQPCYLMNKYLTLNNIWTNIHLRSMKTQIKTWINRLNSKWSNMKQLLTIWFQMHRPWTKLLKHNLITLHRVLNQEHHHLHSPSLVLNSFWFFHFNFDLLYFFWDFQCNWVLSFQSLYKLKSKLN